MNGIFPARLAGRLAASFAGCLILAGISLAEEPKPAEPAKDYTKGFEMFSKLGVPDVKDATYMQLNGENQWFRVGSDESGDEGKPKEKMTGNAWMLSKKEDGGVFLDEECHVAELRPAEKARKEWQAKLKELAKSGKASSPTEMRRLSRAMDRRSSGEWKEADLGKDIRALLDRLGKMKEGDRSMRNDVGLLGKIFLFAHHIHRKGHTQEANEVLGHIFRLAGDSRLVVQTAVEIVGGAQYSQALEDFNRTRDWTAFSKALTDLPAKMPPTWEQAPLVKRLADAVAKRAAMKETPAITGEGLTDEDHALARELAESKKEDEEGFSRYGGLWIAGDGTETPADAGVMERMERIVARRVKSFPLLMALAKDETLMPFVPSGGWRRQYRHSRSEGLRSEEEILQAYQSMARPATRGEFAQLLLSSIVGEQGGRAIMGDASNPGVDGLLKKSREWYAKNASKTESELLRSYLAGEDVGNRYQAIYALVATGKDEDALAIEKYFLESKNLNNDLGMASEYVAQRGVKAKDFVEKYVVRIGGEPETESEKHMHESTVEQRAQRIAQLQDLVSGKSAETAIKEILSQTSKWNQETWQKSGGMLYPKLSAEKPSKALSLLLDATLQSKDPFLMTQFLQLGGYVASGGQRRMNRRASKPANPAGEENLPLKIEAHAELWKKVMAITVPVAEDEFAAPEQDGVTIGGYSAVIMNQIYDPELAYDTKVNMALQGLGRRGWEALRVRWEARLAGKPEAEWPAIPAAENVAPERRAKLAASLVALEGDALWKAVQALPAEEQLALGEMTAKDEALNAKLLPVANLIRVARVQVDDPAWKAWGKTCEGKPWTRKMAEEARDLGEKTLRDGHPILVTLLRKGCCQGMEIRVQKSGRAAEQYAGHARRQKEQKDSLVGVLAAYGNTTRLNAAALWAVDVAAGGKADAKTVTPKPVGKAGADGKDDLLEADTVNDYETKHQEKTRKDFWEKVDTICGPKLDAGIPASIIFAGIPAKKDEAKK